MTSVSTKGSLTPVPYLPKRSFNSFHQASSYDLGTSASSKNVKTSLFSSFPQTRESREIIPRRRNWTPAFAGVTVLETSYENILID